MKRSLRLTLILSFILIFELSILQSKEKKINGGEIRLPTVAGSFYPETPDQLKKTVKGYLKNAKSLGIKERIVSVLVPHAGYQFSGQIAALSYKQIKGKKVDTVILLGPSHRAGFPTISVYPKGYYKTPLGLIEVDSVLANRLLRSHSQIQHYPPAHLSEHSLEVQLPFLQVLFPKVKIVPIVMGGQTKKNVEILIDAIVKVMKDPEGKKIMLITTCDYSHYYPYEKAVELDMVAMDGIRKMDYEEFLSLVKEDKCEMDAYGSSHNYGGCKKIGS